MKEPTMTRNILCVDDDESVRKLLTDILIAKGHAVSVATNGKEAIDLVTVTQFDAIITDHQMPEITGLELVRHLRAAAYAGKIFVFSGALSTPLRKEYEALKVDAIAAKPMGVSEILALFRMP
jgi:CheY-like chemotaxis protein